ncbi:ABC transporter ATP-binding protein [Egibacter rhizosphaerae]|uniref:ABC transporter ATP-binding protein n=2 Tax=Egibacter rhizosphaerae TaxID=1670831 RepID=A0A411YLT6_9ACTN|nr:ABC transporter ATP-binding protein [Egibacter rhizosphaerae]
MGIREEPRSFAIAVTGSAVYGLATVGSAIVLGAVIDRVVEPAFIQDETSTLALAAAAAALAGVAFAKAAGIVVRKVAATWMQAALHARYRKRITRQYTRLPLSWHRRHTTGELLSNANADVEATFWPIAPLPLTCGVVVMLVGSGVALVATDPWMAAVGIAVAPIISFVNWRFNTAMRGPATRAQQKRADVAEVAHESFDGALVVKTLGRESEETQRFREEADELRDELIRFGRIKAVFDPLMEALPALTILGLLVVGGLRLEQGAISTGDLVLVGYLFTLLAFPLRAIGMILSDLPRSVVGWNRVERVLKAESDEPDGEADLPRADGRPADLALDEVRYVYEDPGARETLGGAPGSRPRSAEEDPRAEAALRDVTFDVPAGRTVALVGPTGAGKSTIASLLVRLADPAGGSVAVDGADVRELRRAALTRDVAVVLQHAFLFDDTIRENVTLGADVDDDEVWQALRVAQAEGFVSELDHGLDTVVGERGTTLSGGQRQRVALARALVRRPRLLVLDDATSSVDPSVEAAILAGLREAELPATILVVAYRRATIALADEIVYVERGRVVDRGSHDDLFARVPGYRHLVSAYDRAERAGGSDTSHGGRG